MVIKARITSRQTIMFADAIFPVSRARVCPVMSVSWSTATVITQRPPKPRNMWVNLSARTVICSQLPHRCSAFEIILVVPNKFTAK